MMKAGGDDDENSGIVVVSLEDGLNAMEANSSQLGDEWRPPLSLQMMT